jgi:hypothetical protein
MAEDGHGEPVVQDPVVRARSVLKLYGGEVAVRDLDLELDAGTITGVFGPGFILTLERFLPPLRAFAWLLPPTYGIALLRDVMLRCVVEQPLMLAKLAAFAAALFALSWMLLRRRVAPR